MSRDYTPRKAANNRRKPAARNARVKPSRKSLPGWLWLVAGVLIGILINAVVDFSGDGAGGDAVAKQEPEKAAPAEDKTSATAAGESRQTPRFDFYTLLKESEAIVPEEDSGQPAERTIVIPDTEKEDKTAQSKESDGDTPAASDFSDNSGKEASAQEKAASAPPEEREVYVLQAGSFKSAADADSVRASLLLLNMKANIEKVTIAPGETWHRVLVGPFTTKSALGDAQATLRQNGIDSLQLKRRM